MQTSLSVWWSRWPHWSAYAAAAWSLGYGALGLYWALGGGGFPFGRDHDHEGGYSVLANASAESTAPVIAALGLLGAIAAFVMARAAGRGVARMALASFAWVVAATLAVVLTDLRLLMLVTRILVVPVFAVTGVPGGHSIADFFPWPRLNLLVVVSGGLLWGLAALAYQRRTREQVCANCGRDGTVAAWTTPRRATHWGRWAVCAAVVVPAFYTISRASWVFGHNLGVPQSIYDEGTGIIFGGLFMAALALGGAVLTLGLIQPWGEVFPRWTWFAAGRRVPPPLAIIPATVIAVFVTSAGITEIRRLLDTGIGMDEWAIKGPGILWPLWGIAIGVATYAYYLRRRTTCQHCGQGTTADADRIPAGAR